MSVKQGMSFPQWTKLLNDRLTTASPIDHWSQVASGIQLYRSYQHGLSWSKVCDKLLEDAKEMPWIHADLTRYIPLKTSYW